VLISFHGKIDVLISTKMNWATFWATFSRAHLITLAGSPVLDNLTTVHRGASQSDVGSETNLEFLFAHRTRKTNKNKNKRNKQTNKQHKQTTQTNNTNKQHKQTKTKTKQTNKQKQNKQTSKKTNKQANKQTKQSKSSP
jgi:Mg-chelatase subunit ChlI